MSEQISLKIIALSSVIQKRTDAPREISYIPQKALLYLVL